MCIRLNKARTLVLYSSTTTHTKTGGNTRIEVVQIYMYMVASLRHSLFLICIRDSKFMLGAAITTLCHQGNDFSIKGKLSPTFYMVKFTIRSDSEIAFALYIIYYSQRSSLSQRQKAICYFDNCLCHRNCNCDMVLRDDGVCECVWCVCVGVCGGEGRRVLGVVGPTHWEK